MFHGQSVLYCTTACSVQEPTVLSIWVATCGKRNSVLPSRSHVAGLRCSTGRGRRHLEVHEGAGVVALKQARVVHFVRVFKRLFSLVCSVSVDSVRLVGAELEVEGELLLLPPTTTTTTTTSTPAAAAAAVGTPASAATAAATATLFASMHDLKSRFPV